MGSDVYLSLSLLTLQAFPQLSAESVSLTGGVHVGASVSLTKQVRGLRRASAPF